MVTEKNTSIKKTSVIRNVPVPPLIQKNVLSERKTLKGVSVDSIPLPPLFLEEEMEQEPSDFVTPQHGLFKKFNLFHLGSRKVFPIMRETVSVPEQDLPSFPQDALSLPQKQPSSLPPAPLEEKVRVDIAPDPWQKTQELLLKCRSAIEKGKVDYAQIYYEELQPFYPRLDSYQQGIVSQIIFDIQQDLEMLKLRKLREQLKKAY